ncbi:MAG: hypothetical protein ABI969_18055 [bacterium]
MRRLLIMLPILLASNHAGAQIIRQRFGMQTPSAWISGGVGLQQAFSVTDGTTGTQWQFGSATTYGGSIEKALSNGMTLGVRGSTGIIPLNYAGAAVTFNADARVSQLFGTLRLASGEGFHTVLELSAGATNYSDFKTQTTAMKLEPLAGDTDFAFSFGYGFGYNLSPRVSVDVVQDIATSVHQKHGLAPGDDSTVRIHGTRITGRIGLGGRR